MVKNLPANAGDAGLIPGVGRSPREGNGNLVQYSSLGNPVDRGAWQAIVHGVTKSQTRLTMYVHTSIRVFIKMPGVSLVKKSGLDCSKSRGMEWYYLVRDSI